MSLRIIEIDTLPLKYCYNKAIFDARLGYSCREALLVLIKTNLGVTGIGEAAVFGNAANAVKEAVKTLAPYIMNENPLLVERIWEKLFQTTWQWGQAGISIMALSGIDIALWDIVGKVAGMPLYQIFGGSRELIPAYASGGFYREGGGIDSLKEEVTGYTEKGFRAIKIKIGRQPSDLLPGSTVCRVSLEDDLARVAAVREAVGDELVLMLDANNAWENKLAIRAIRLFQEFKPFFIEEPISLINFQNSALLRQKSDIPIAGYETLSSHGLTGYKKLIANRAVDIVQFDVTWCGGLTAARKIAALAAANGLICIPHCFSSAVALAATLHLLASIPNSSYIELDQNSNPLRTELLEKPLNINKGGFLRVLQEPGLGIKLSRDTINKYLAIGEK